MATRDVASCMRILSRAECLELIEPGGIGRVGVTSPNGVVILPVNFATQGEAIIFRTAPDTLLAVYASAQVSFEADRFDETTREGWSVLVHGHAHKVTDKREVTALERGTRLQPWAPGARDVYVRVSPAWVSGRRIRRSGDAGHGTDPSQI
jgi:nitroimidazol reductase NimA-like FMN-containing flavoprotein (pyridoxamine 5'-phosphate oxidase superfamily)